VIPANTVSIQGQGVVPADLLNSYVQLCPSVAQLRSFTGLPNMQVALQGSVTPGDGLGGDFYWNATATATDDGITVIRPSGVTVGAWLRLSTYGSPQTGGNGGVYIDDLGAVANDPSFDNSPIITAALATYPYVRGRAAAYYCNSGITVPDGKTFEGDVFFANLAEPFGSQLIFANNVPTCVQVGTGNTNNPAGFTKWQVRRQGATPPAGSIGILFAAGQSPKFDWIGSCNHAVCIEFAVQSGSPAGITAQGMGIYTAGATDAHIVDNTWPELFLTLVRTGCNGGVDANCNTHWRITGGGPGGNGPNGLQVVNWQSNQGQNTAAYWLQLVNLIDTASNAVEFRFAEGHAEGMGTACIMTDASCAFLNRLNITDTEFNAPGIEMWAINAATQFSDVFISGCNCFTTTWTFEPAIAPNVFNVVNSFLGSTCTISTPPNSTMNYSNCAFGNLVLSGAGNIVFSGCNLIGGSLTNTATGRVIASNNSNFSGSRNWTPALQFGGAAVGLTTSFDSGEYEWLSLDTVRITYSIILTAVGSSTGSATIANLPAISNPVFGSAAGGPLGFYANMQSLSGPLLQGPNNNSAILNFYQAGSTGLTAVSNSDFTNTSAISGELVLRTA
jgi:hypothetical protein